MAEEGRGREATGSGGRKTGAHVEEEKTRRCVGGCCAEESLQRVVLM